MFDISELFIQCTTNSYCEHKVGVNVYIYMGVSVCWSLSVLCVLNMLACQQ